MANVLVQETPFKTISVEPLHPTFGASVSGVDFENTSDEQLREIIAAMAQYGVCVFRDTHLTDAGHVAFSRRLGALDDIGRFLTPQRKLRYAHLELFDASNLDDTGTIIDPHSPRAHAGRGNGIFHVDSSFNPRRASFSLLRAVAVPPPGATTGGNTDFADSRAAWDDLDPGVKEELLERDWTGAHCLAQSRKLGSPEYFRDVDPAVAPMAKHKIVQRHEASGRFNLYVGAHLHHIEGDGMTPGASAELVASLNERVTQDKNVLSVAWEQPGDLVIWDNRAVLHRAGKWDGDGKYARDMRRTTVHDDSPTAWGLNPVGSPMPTMASFTKGPVITNAAQAQAAVVKV
ncbi:alpha-ketoglutarate-dependent 2,4-dichlorophenoxyacetate dioxygenase [Lasiosphaeris hirsuta]|uniref:Alpha-ketoglutarate-dependent 2,4-dichlorophenoxyacetate dioxygenase n=1 Tax=Lasiosphaeris hirsuta TaxID=260670 RepID=A0AA39ZWM7_9PEZI|nr:alpha-ketoglutarate-dependent 2,4-dichlorophenoxyacetate dioxygenase [Lasiosphaeris hirsuta]